MTGFVIDTSALIAVLLVESEAEQFSEYLDRETSAWISTSTLHEAFCVVRRPTIRNGYPRLQEMVGLVGPEIAPFDLVQLEAAKVAYFRYGRGSGHSADLNMGDCFSYALAKTRNLPLLFKGDDFIHTDIEPALKPA